FMRTFFFRAHPTTVIFTLSLHDALPISEEAGGQPRGNALGAQEDGEGGGEVFAVSLLALEEEVGERIRMLSGKLHGVAEARAQRSEEHTSELQSREKLVCRLLLEKKNTT